MAELANLENWCHLNPNVLSTGRVVHFAEAALEEEKQALLDALNEQEPVEARLKALSEDKRNLWNIIKIYDMVIFGIILLQ